MPEKSDKNVTSQATGKQEVDDDIVMYAATATGWKPLNREEFYALQESHIIDYIGLVTGATYKQRVGKP